jgi:hypothetical protein
MWLNQYEEIGIILNQRQPIAKPTEARTCPHMGWVIERRICALAVEEWRTPLDNRLQSRISHSLNDWNLCFTQSSVTPAIAVRFSTMPQSVHRQLAVTIYLPFLTLR